VGNESIKHLKQGVRGGAEEMDRADQLKTDSEKGAGFSRLRSLANSSQASQKSHSVQAVRVSDHSSQSEEA